MTQTHNQASDPKHVISIHSTHKLQEYDSNKQH